MYSAAPTLGPIDQSLKDALTERGLVDGRSIELLYRYANGIPAQLPKLAAELAAQKPDLLLAIGGDIIKALFDASKGTIPIAGAVSDNPMRAGIAASGEEARDFPIYCQRLSFFPEVPEHEAVAELFLPLK